MKGILRPALICTLWCTPALAQVNKGNLEVARMCSDVAYDLLSLSTLAMRTPDGEPVFVSDSDPIHESQKIERRLWPQLRFFYDVVAAENTYSVLEEHKFHRELSRAAASVSGCLTGDVCVENAGSILASAAVDLLKACRRDYHGESG